MALRYEWCWDIAVIGALAVKVTDDGAAFEVRLTSGTYCHTDISTVDADFTDFAAALQSALQAGTAGAGTYAVTWNGTTGYTIAYTAGNITLSFTTVTTAAEGTLMRQILGYSGNKSGAASHASDVRPYYLIIPAIQGRTEMSDEYETGEMMRESSADDGTTYQISRDSSEIWSDWTQAAETETAPSSYSSAGTFIYKRLGTSAAPWTYQHAWEHMREAKHPFLVLDGSESAVHQIRADGASFHPTRFAGTDLPHWSVPFKTRLIGRL